MGYLPYQLVQDFFHQQQDRNVTQNWWLLHLQNMSTHLHGSYNRVLRAAPAQSGCQNCSDTALYQAFTCSPTSPWTDHLAMWHSGNNNSKHTDSIEMHSTLCKKCFGCWVCKTNASVNFSTFAAIGLILQTVVTGHFKLDGILIFPVQGCTRRPAMHGKTKECNLPGCRNVISKASLLVDALKASQMKKVNLQIHPSTSKSTVSSTSHSTVLKLISKKKASKKMQKTLA